MEHSTYNWQNSLSARLRKSKESIIRQSIEIVLCHHSALWIVILPALLKLYGIKANIFCKELYKYLCPYKTTKIVFSSAGNIKFFDKSCFYKIGFIDTICSNLESEYDNWLIVSKDDKFSAYIIGGMQMKRSGNLCVLITPLIGQVERKDYINSLNYVLDGVHKYSKKRSAIIPNDMLIGLNYLVKLFCKSDFNIKSYFENKLEGFEKQICDFGFVHGDLHPGNIMIQDGKYVMIDTARCSLDGIQAFDVIHAVIEITKGKYSWFDRLIYYHQNGWEGDPAYEHFKKFIDIDEQYLVYSYFLDRVGKEYKDSLIIKENWKDLIYKFLQNII
jgi:hypothetical protein